MKQTVYIDGQNVAHINDNTLSGLRIKAALEAMEKSGFEAHAILPSYLTTGKKNKRKTIKNQDIIEKLVSEKRLSLVSNNDDKAIITIAYDNDAFILTNDRYSDHKEEEWWTPEIDNWIKSKLIPFDFIGDEFSIPLNVRHHLNIKSEDSPILQISIPDFKAHATNGGISPDMPLEVFPESVQEMLKLISQNPDEITFAALGSHLKSATGCKLKDLFGKTKHTTRFLESRGYPIRHDKDNTYVKGIAA